MSKSPFYSIPAREPNEDLVDEWAFQLRSSLIQGGLERVKEKVSELYSESIESGNKNEEAAYNLGIAAAKAYEDINIDQRDWNKRIEEGLITGRNTRESDLRKVRDLLTYGIRDRDALLDKDYEV